MTGLTHFQNCEESNGVMFGPLLPDEGENWADLQFEIEDRELDLELREIYGEDPEDDDLDDEEDEVTVNYAGLLWEDEPFFESNKARRTPEPR